MYSSRYQIALIVLGVAITGLLGFFVYQEMFPEYRIYQNDYVALEKFRSTYTGEPPPVFNKGVKQIVFEREDKGPASVDRCISCHVATELPHFSPTQVVYDANGKVVRDKEGIPLQEPNENYVWKKLDDKVNELKTINPNEANHLEALKIAVVGDQIYDVTKVLAMHPLIGKETRAFEFHSIEEYGCTSCHSGNGRGLTTEKAHGPVFDGQYGIEHEGDVPQFIEKDDQNDPIFSRVFNHKPDDSLLFQTTPILVGNLIQSSCVQCHSEKKQLEATSIDDGLSADYKKNMDIVVSNYHQGEQLFVSQACYACHKIAGVARGGVGPELTKSGLNYPWYLKESIVWPQADLRTSTMPNFKLDHVELEDLMTFLLAQKGAKKSVSQMEHKLAIQEWEAGVKSPIEMRVPPSKIHDLRYSMTVFATEGCASCHRLEGFVSNVGFAIEKDHSSKQTSFDVLYKEKQWFRSLFPEEIQGSDIVQAVQLHSKEINEHIVDGVRANSLLEEIETKFPEIIESFYSNFRYASRAKNTEYGQASEALKLWKDLIRRVLLVYIQEYGLGRLIGPRPNWSGIYRSDEWLMEHFRNPAGHVPRSIMPVFPFDTSKFTSLIFMLNQLGKQNRDHVNAIWEHQGFNPELAYQIYCAQCHGNYLQGDGPVATWIYPIPKNLRSGEFLRNLTKENVMLSIMHGVKGTSMPPWNEVKEGNIQQSQKQDELAVISKENIEKLVDWLFRSLPGGAVIKNRQDVPKWNYYPQDILTEIHQEHGNLNEQSVQVSDVFNVVANPISGGEEDLYYIKRSLYTPENLEKGQQFFMKNCAYCHGTDADGMGVRASIMVDAKPRMLTNLDWLTSRDDLRLLRSIKYGVSGTAMTPWGDLTTALQRLQLVMYIRSVSFDKERREALLGLLYRTFDTSMDVIEAARIESYPQLADLEKQDAIVEEERRQPSVTDEKSLLLYQKHLQLAAQIKKLSSEDQALLDLKQTIKDQQLIYTGIGNAFISANVDEAVWLSLLKWIETNSDRFIYKNKKLSINLNHDTTQQRVKLLKELNNQFDSLVVDKQKELLIVQGKLSSVERDQEVRNIHQSIESYRKLKLKMDSGEAESDRLRNQQLQLLKSNL